MPASFFVGTNNYATLYTGTISFSTQISATPTAFGLTAPQAAAYAALSETYTEAYLRAESELTRTKGAIVARNDAAVPLRQMASDLAKIIDGTPSVTNEQKTDLGLAVRATPSPAPAPGTCSNLKTELLADGTLALSWKANNPSGLSGVTYQVWRRIGDVGEFAFLTSCGEKKTTDSTIPQGTVQAQYQIRGVRPTGAGAWATFIVNFAKDTSGVLAANVTNTSPVKIAA